MKKLFYLLIGFSISCSDSSDKNTKSAESVKIVSTPKKEEPKIISNSTNVLENKFQKIELEYIVWGCACANWITPKDLIKYQDSGLAKHCIFIEPADCALELPGNFQPQLQKIIVEGQFYVRADYPRGTIQTEETLEKAKVFTYTKIKVIKK
jgi:hypothetical protein